MSTSTYKQDPIKNLSNARNVDTLTPPPGVNLNRKVDIVELDIDTKEAVEHFAKYTSVDGKEYLFRTHSKKGEALPWRETLSLYLGIRESALGGSPFTVFDAFRLNIADMRGQQVYPVQLADDSPISLG